MMRACPTCGAQCFDDMDVCYGCLHRFAADEGAVRGYRAKPDQRAPQGVGGAERAKPRLQADQLPLVERGAGKDAVAHAHATLQENPSAMVVRIEIPTAVFFSAEPQDRPSPVAFEEIAVD